MKKNIQEIVFTSLVLALSFGSFTASAAKVVQGISDCWSYSSMAKSEAFGKLHRKCYEEDHQLIACTTHEVSGLGVKGCSGRYPYGAIVTGVCVTWEEYKEMAPDLQEACSPNN